MSSSSMVSGLLESERCSRSQIVQQSNENLPPQVVTRLMKEIHRLCSKPPEGITVDFAEDNMTNINAEIDGPGALGRVL